MDLYFESGFFDITKVLALKLTFNFIIGGRGTGKTYSALKYVYENNIRFAMLRRTQQQADLIGRPIFNPFNSVTDTMTCAPLSKNISGFYLADEEGRPMGSPLGYTCALSTISNMRGFDSSETRMIIFDEFIPERHERPIKNEAAAFFNAYETINRNREFGDINGEPVICVALANSTSIVNPIFMELKIVNKISEVRRKGKNSYINREKSFGVFLLDDSPIADMKKETSLYKMTAESAYSEMALDNSFIDLDDKFVKSQPIVEYKPLCSIGEIGIYGHKSGGRLYVSGHKSGGMETYSLQSADIERFRKRYAWFYLAFLDGIVSFETLWCKEYFRKMLKGN